MVDPSPPTSARVTALSHAIVWAAVILGCAWVTRGSGMTPSLLIILGGGAAASLIVNDQSSGPPA